MPDAGEADDNGDAASQQAAPIPPSESGAQTPNPQDVSDDNNERVHANRERYIYKPLKTGIERLDKYSGAVTAIATVVIMGATIVNVVYVGGQLSEMKSTGTQTDSLIKSNGDLASAAKDQARAEAETAKTAGIAMIAAQRAWMNPSVAAINALEAYKPIKGVIGYANVGHEPATDANFILDQRIFTKFDWDNSGLAFAQILKDKGDCMAIKNTILGKTTFPSNPVAVLPPYLLHFYSVGFDGTALNGFVADKGVIDGDSVFMVDICIIYKTYDKVRHSTSCFYFKKDISEVGALNICTGGDDAD
jgi:hypothetical protein